MAGEDILFTSEVAEGAFVGPNNVMVLEIRAQVYGQPQRESGKAALLIVFPSPRKTIKDGDNNPNELADEF
jgi:hypothetical protein